MEYGYGNYNDYRLDDWVTVNGEHILVNGMGEAVGGAPVPQDSKMLVDGGMGKERIKNAFDAEDAEEALDKFFPQAQKAWNSMTEEEKDTVVHYTSAGYDSMNNMLRGTDKVKNMNQKFIKEEIDIMTKAINKCELEQDTVLYRGIGQKGLKTLFGNVLNELGLDDFSDMYIKDLKSVLVGRVGTDNAFGSCGSSEKTGFTEKDYQLRIIAPKGTKAMYVEPFSAYGDGDGRQWDGKKKQESVGEENETIMQRGTTYKVIDVHGMDGIKTITLEAIAQANL